MLPLRTTDPFSRPEPDRDRRLLNSTLTTNIGGRYYYCYYYHYYLHEYYYFGYATLTIISPTIIHNKSH